MLPDAEISTSIVETGAKEIRIGYWSFGKILPAAYCCWILDARYWMLDAGYWMLDTGCWMLVSDLGKYCLLPTAAGCWILIRVCCSNQLTPALKGG